MVQLFFFKPLTSCAMFCKPYLLKVEKKNLRLFQVNDMTFIISKTTNFIQDAI